MSFAFMMLNCKTKKVYDYISKESHFYFLQLHHIPYYFILKFLNLFQSLTKGECIFNDTTTYMIPQTNIKKVFTMGMMPTVSYIL